MNHKYFDYKEDIFSCPHCGWEGLGKDVEDGEMFAWEGFETICPQCRKKLPDTVTFPTAQDGHDSLIAQGLISPGTPPPADQWAQLFTTNFDEVLPPYEPGKTYSFAMKEVGLPFLAKFQVYLEGKFLFEEVAYFEYFDRYLEIGEVLFAKYGTGLKEFTYDCTTLFCGDFSSSDIERLDKFEKKIHDAFHGLPYSE